MLKFTKATTTEVELDGASLLELVFAAKDDAGATFAAGAQPDPDDCEVEVGDGEAPTSRPDLRRLRIRLRWVVEPVLRAVGGRSRPGP